MHTRHGCAQDGCTPLHVASRYGHAAVVAALLAAGGNKDAADKVRVCVCVCVCERSYWGLGEGLDGRVSLCVVFR